MTDETPRTQRKDRATVHQEGTQGSRRAGVGAQLREDAREAEDEPIYADDLPLAFLSLGPDGLKITFADTEPDMEAPDER